MGPSSRVWPLLAALVVQLTDSIPTLVALRFQAIHMPTLVQRGTNFWLACSFELEPDQQLYSVKWYHNNEEFYRLIVAPSSTGGSAAAKQQHQVDPAGQQATTAGPSSNFQQQYFAQIGVNVMMSQSNATHVRLLNASLESEGQYACEISTQNLSTIRHEKELKVYVLPNSKLQVIGLRNRYSMGDQVELKCVADFSRPAPALGWFINGQRITAELQASWNLELSGRSRSKLNEPELVGTSLALKFKLSHELLAGLVPPTPAENAGSSDSHQAAGPAPLPGRNQSQSSWPRPGPLELLKLQCKYKLIEVADVTYNELLVRRRPTPAAAHKRPRQQPDAPTHAHAPRRNQRGRPHADWPSGPLLVKSAAGAGQQIIQRPACIRPGDRAWLELVRSSRWLPDACRRLGSLALQPDDPVILRPLTAADGAEPTPDEATHDMGQDSAPSAAVLLAEPGDQLEANCSTLGGLLDWMSGEAGSHLAEPVESSWPRETPTGSQESSWPLDDPHDDWSRLVALGPMASGHCSQPEARRRELISGRHQTNELDPLAGASSANQFAPPGRRQAPPRSSSAERAGPASAATAQVSAGALVAGAADKTQQVAYLSLGHFRQHPAGSRAADSSGPPVASNGHHNINDQQPGSVGQQQQLVMRQQILAPPLLEWFINYQEAPRSSTSGYAPELPLVGAPAAEGPVSLSLARQPDDDTGPGPTSDAPSRGADRSWARLDSRPLGGATRPGQPGEPADGQGAPGGGPEVGPAPARSPDLLPSVDYSEYFANLDQRRPIEQQLTLRLRIEKRHFMAPDSTLRLRCSSTKALVLISDSLTVKIIGLASNLGPAAGSNGLRGPASGVNNVWIQHNHTNQPAKPHHNWRQRNPSALDGRGSPSNHYSKKHHSSSNNLPSLDGHYNLLSASNQQKSSTASCEPAQPGSLIAFTLMLGLLLGSVPLV